MSERPSNRAELVAVARDAVAGIRPAIKLIRDLAIEAGYEGRRGGWIYSPDARDRQGAKGMAQGWQAFAGLIVDESRRTADRLLSVLEPAPAPQTSPADYRTEQEKRDADAPFTEPAVPQAWVDQLVTLLDAGARIKLDRVAGWILDGGPFAMRLDRLQPAVGEAIRLGIACELPPTPGQGVVRLALWRHAYGDSHSGMACGAMILRDGYGDQCGLPAGHPIHNL